MTTQTTTPAQNRAIQFRAAALRVYAIVAFIVFIVLASVVHKTPYFKIDLAITRYIQSYHGSLFDRSMSGLSWFGYPPQVEIFAGLCILGLYIFGLRWEAVAGLFAGGGAVLGVFIKMLVNRPRPGSDLVHVVRELTTASFPSGHVLTITSFCGFLVFLVYALLKPGLARAGLAAVLLLVIVFMGVSRIYLGEHWFSDVIGAYLLGTLWLAITARFYAWGKTQYFVRKSPPPPVR